MTRMQERTAHCPVCALEFDFSVLLSTNSAGGVESDFRARAVGVDFVPFTVLTCPRCSYSAETATFEQPVPPGVAYQLKALADLLLGGSESRHARRFQLAAELLDLNVHEPREAGWMYLRASWMAREEHDADAEALCQRRARDAFRKYLTASATADDAPRIRYLMGELARRLGEFEDACTWLDQVPAGDRLFPEAVKMLERARRQDRAPARFGE